MTTAATTASKRPSRVGVYGGSFDPPHIAHVLAAAYVVSSGVVDRLLVIPTYRHALGKSSRTPFSSRLEMTRLAMGTLRGVEVRDIEGSLPPPSHTLQTLEALRREDPSSTLRLVVGADILREADQWHRWEDVVRIAPLVVVGRDGVARPQSLDHGALLPLELPRVSSTEVRRLLAAGDSVDGWVPGAVQRYVEDHGLYR